MEEKLSTGIRQYQSQVLVSLKEQIENPENTASVINFAKNVLREKSYKHLRSEIWRIIINRIVERFDEAYFDSMTDFLIAFCLATDDQPEKTDGETAVFLFFFHFVDHSLEFHKGLIFKPKIRSVLKQLTLALPAYLRAVILALHSCLVLRKQKESQISEFENFASDVFSIINWISDSHTTVLSSQKEIIPKNFVASTLPLLLQTSSLCIELTKRKNLNVRNLRFISQLDNFHIKNQEFVVAFDLVLSWIQNIGILDFSNTNLGPLTQQLVSVTIRRVFSSSLTPDFLMPLILRLQSLSSFYNSNECPPSLKEQIFICFAFLAWSFPQDTSVLPLILNSIIKMDVIKSSEICQVTGDALVCQLESQGADSLDILNLHLLKEMLASLDRSSIAVSLSSGFQSLSSVTFLSLVPNIFLKSRALRVFLTSRSNWSSEEIKIEEDPNEAFSPLLCVFIVAITLTTLRQDQETITCQKRALHYISHWSLSLSKANSKHSFANPILLLPHILSRIRNQKLPLHLASDLINAVTAIGTSKLYLPLAYRTLEAAMSGAACNQSKKLVQMAVCNMLLFGHLPLKKASNFLPITFPSFKAEILTACDAHSFEILLNMTLHQPDKISSFLNIIDGYFQTIKEQHVEKEHQENISFLALRCVTVASVWDVLDLSKVFSFVKDRFILPSLSRSYTPHKSAFLRVLLCLCYWTLESRLQRLDKAFSEDYFKLQTTKFQPEDLLKGGQSSAGLQLPANLVYQDRTVKTILTFCRWCIKSAFVNRTDEEGWLIRSAFKVVGLAASRIDESLNFEECPFEDLLSKENTLQSLEGYWNLSKNDRPAFPGTDGYFNILAEFAAQERELLGRRTMKTIKKKEPLAALATRLLANLNVPRSSRNRHLICINELLNGGNSHSGSAQSSKKADKTKEVKAKKLPQLLTVKHQTPSIESKRNSDFAKIQEILESSKVGSLAFRHVLPIMWRNYFSRFYKHISAPHQIITEVTFMLNELQSLLKTTEFSPGFLLSLTSSIAGLALFCPSVGELCSKIIFNFLAHCPQVPNSASSSCNPDSDSVIDESSAVAIFTSLAAIYIVAPSISYIPSAAKEMCRTIAEPSRHMNKCLDFEATAFYKSVSLESRSVPLFNTISFLIVSEAEKHPSKLSQAVEFFLEFFHSNRTGDSGDAGFATFLKGLTTPSVGLAMIVAIINRRGTSEDFLLLSTLHENFSAFPFVDSSLLIVLSNLVPALIIHGRITQKGLEDYLNKIIQFLDTSKSERSPSLSIVAAGHLYSALNFMRRHYEENGTQNLFAVPRKEILESLHKAIRRLSIPQENIIPPLTRQICVSTLSESAGVPIIFPHVFDNSTFRRNDQEYQFEGNSFACASSIAFDVLFGLPNIMDQNVEDLLHDIEIVSKKSAAAVTSSSGVGSELPQQDGSLYLGDFNLAYLDLASCVVISYLSKLLPSRKPKAEFDSKELGSILSHSLHVLQNVRLNNTDQHKLESSAEQLRLACRIFHSVNSIPNLKLKHHLSTLFADIINLESQQPSHPSSSILRRLFFTGVRLCLSYRSSEFDTTEILLHYMTGLDRLPVLYRYGLVSQLSSLCTLFPIQAPTLVHHVTQTAIRLLDTNPTFFLLFVKQLLHFMGEYKTENLENEEFVYFYPSIDMVSTKQSTDLPTFCVSVEKVILVFCSLVTDFSPISVQLAFGHLLRKYRRTAEKPEILTDGEILRSSIACAVLYKEFPEYWSNIRKNLITKTILLTSDKTDISNTNQFNQCVAFAYALSSFSLADQQIELRRIQECINFSSVVQQTATLLYFLSILATKAPTSFSLLLFGLPSPSNVPNHTRLPAPLLPEPIDNAFDQIEIPIFDSSFLYMSPEGTEILASLTAQPLFNFVLPHDPPVTYLVATDPWLLPLHWALAESLEEGQSDTLGVAAARRKRKLLAADSVVVDKKNEI
eukprot:GHVP01012754.1.p1 GENE.GHVP01012754.1~~GHVP01012754.1.p1  ORF type:complete len:1937 (-),score=332.74 GHVP01012754.1:429-6239(-)